MLLRRVFLVNAAVLCAFAVATVLVLSPGLISEPIAVRELALLAVSLLVMLVVNLGLLRQAFEPLVRVAALVDHVDPRRPGERVAVPDDDSEPTRLAEAFNEMLDRLEVERQASARRALAAQEAERLRVAQELHDEIGQSLTAVLLQLERAARSGSSDTSEALSEAKETVRASLEDIRRIARRLRPEALDDLGLGAALAAFADQLSERTGLVIDRRLGERIPPLGYEEELVIYRVAQEALTNVVRHSGSQTAELALKQDNGLLRLRVADRGQGLRGEQLSSGGIRGMVERALLIDARVSVEERDGGGVEVLLEVPIDEAS